MSMRRWWPSARPASRRRSSCCSGPSPTNRAAGPGWRSTPKAGATASRAWPRRWHPGWPPNAGWSVSRCWAELGTPPAAVRRCRSCGPPRSERPDHLHMPDAGLLEGLTPSLEARSQIEVLGRQLRMQQHLAVALLLGLGHQRAQHQAADLAPAHRAQHGHTADLGDAGHMLQQAAGGQRQAEAVARQRMQAAGVGGVPFHVGGDVLFLHEHLAADGRRRLAKFAPAAQHHVDHRLAGLEVVHQAAQGIGQMDGRLRGGVGEDIDHLGLHQHLLAMEDGAVDLHRAVAELAGTDADVQPVVVAGRAAVVQRCTAHIEVAAELLHRVGIGDGQRPPIAADRGVQIGEVVAVEDDALGIDLGPAHAQGLEVAEVGALHGVSVSLMAWAQASSAVSASGMCRPILMKSWVTPRYSSSCTGTPAARSVSA
mmetsp:Transcript_5237/g.19599  ORF Transcript_5237/g.19599 Transcript_5237/m.19599 type:complete len:426 (+) Transcript_5237:594-1871(+)